MKKILILFLLVSVLSIAPTQQSHAVVWVVVKAALKKAIKAMDLAIQRQQNKVIWLQNAQKTLENTMSKLKLDEIGNWVEKQRSLYRDYFEELQKVKNLLADYQRIKDIYNTQSRLVAAYKQSMTLFKRDGHFSTEELAYMAKVYDGLLVETARNIDQLLLVVQVFYHPNERCAATVHYDKTAAGMDALYNDLRAFNQQNIVLSLQRANDENDLQTTKALYQLHEKLFQWYYYSLCFPCRPKPRAFSTSRDPGLKTWQNRSRCLKLIQGWLQKGYSIAKDGWSTIGSIKRGDLRIHSDHFAAFSRINPAIARYAQSPLTIMSTAHSH